MQIRRVGTNTERMAMLKKPFAAVEDNTTVSHRNYIVSCGLSFRSSLTWPSFPIRRGREGENKEKVEGMMEERPGDAGGRGEGGQQRTAPLRRTEQGGRWRHSETGERSNASEPVLFLVPVISPPTSPFPLFLFPPGKSKECCGSWYQVSIVLLLLLLLILLR